MHRQPVLLPRMPRLGRSLPARGGAITAFATRRSKRRILSPDERLEGTDQLQRHMHVTGTNATDELFKGVRTGQLPTSDALVIVFFSCHTGTASANEII